MNENNMMNSGSSAPQAFSFGASKVRVVMKDGEPWFVASDVAAAIELTSAAHATRLLDDDEKGVQAVYTPGGPQNVNIVNESGLYQLVLRSRKPEAKRFKKWVTSEVLPSIRKHGMYASEELLNNPDLLIAAGTRLKEEMELRKAAELKAKELEETVAKLEPKAEYHDEVLTAENGINITQIAKAFGIRSGRKLNRILERMGVQYKQNGQWLLFAEYCGKGYTVETTYLADLSDGTVETLHHTKWTEKGKQFLYQLLVERGYVEKGLAC